MKENLCGFTPATIEISEDSGEGMLFTASSDSAILGSSHQNLNDPSNNAAHLAGATFSSTSDVTPIKHRLSKRKEEKYFPKNSVEAVH